MSVERGPWHPGLPEGTAQGWHRQPHRPLPVQEAERQQSRSRYEDVSQDSVVRAPWSHPLQPDGDTSTPDSASQEAEFLQA